MVSKEEWEAWLENPVTREYKALLSAKRGQFPLPKPGAGQDPQEFYSWSLIQATKAETYEVMYQSLNAEAYDDIFEEESDD